MNLSIYDDISLLQGVGNKRREILYGMGIHIVKDLLLYFPSRYEHRGDVKLLRDASPDTACSFVLTPDTKAVAIPSKTKKGMMNYRLRAHDESADCTLMFFNQKYAANALVPGKRYRFYGKVKFSRSGILLISPKYELEDNEELKEYLPVYPLKAGMTQNVLRTLSERALSLVNDLDDIAILPPEIPEREKFIDIKHAIHSLHFPSSEEELGQAVKRMMYEELYLFALCIRHSGKNKIRKHSPEMHPVILDKFLMQFPFPPTGAQKRAINEIYHDMVKSEVPMYRLLAGDVGSGKTFPAAAAAFIALANGYQTAMMAPTEILATQHYRDLKEKFENLGFRCALLVGSLKESEKKKLRNALESGEIDFVFGTHALISNKVGFKNPALFITDEQHRFGVNQRKTLSDKGRDANILVMSATPIPRTLAMIIYGDLDLSTLDEMPPGRQKVSTHVIDSSYKDKMYDYLSKEVKKGHQAYIVCPAIEDGNEDNKEDKDFLDLTTGYTIISNFKLEDIKPDIRLSSSTGLYNDLKKKYPDVRFGLMHGKLDSDEKERVMSDFVDHKIDVLVSTTVIEVGVNVPTATIMIIENAERYGLSQLHQLRGRVGRGSEKSYCFLCSDDKSKKAVDRLSALEKNNNGFKIAEFDLKQRGPGDFLPSGSEIRQHGEIKFRFADLLSDMAVLQRAFTDADKILKEDPLLISEKNIAARKAIIEFSNAR